MLCACAAEPRSPSLFTDFHLMQSMLDRALYHVHGAQYGHPHDSQLEVNASVRYALITSQTETQPYLYSIKAVHLSLKVISNTKPYPKTS